MEHNTRLLGGIAYIVLIVFSIFSSVLPFAGIIPLAAAICVMVAFIQASDQLHRPEIKSSIITAVVLYIVAMLVIVFMVGLGVVGAMASGGHDLLAALGATAIMGALIGWVLSIVAVWFWYKASQSLSEATNVPMYKTGGLLMFIGAILEIILIGFILVLIGQILQTVAFFNTPETRTAPANGAF